MNFNRNMSGEEFLKVYNYRAELQQICRELKLPTNGTKADLNERMLDFLMVNQFKSNRKYQIGQYLNH